MGIQFTGTNSLTFKGADVKLSENGVAQLFRVFMTNVPRDKIGYILKPQDSAVIIN